MPKHLPTSQALTRLAVFIATDAPMTLKGADANISAVNELRAELERLGYDWRAGVKSRMKREDNARREYWKERAANDAKLMDEHKPA